MTCFFYEPADHAASEAAAGRYALYSVAMGYHASEKDAQLLGMDCGKAQVETKPLVFGCMPPSNVFFKRIFEYNAAVLKQPGFPHAAACEVDKTSTEKLDAWLAEEVKKINAEKAEHVHKRRLQMRRDYNP
jgi:hypothetical protein